MSEDLVAFLLARIVEDERRAAQIHHEQCAYIQALADMPMDCWCDCEYPARVLAEVEAKRRIIETIIPDVDQMDWQIDQHFGSSSDPPGDTAERLLKLLALPYQDHPQFLSDWAPTTCGNADS